MDMERSAHDERRPAPNRNGGRAIRERREPLKLSVLNDRLGYFIRRAQVWIFQDVMRDFVAIDIRPAQYSVLAVIEANAGLSQSDIADLLGIERARLVRLLDRLERRGYTERRRAPNDRRSHALYLTREGRRALKRIDALAAEHEARVAAKVGPENRKILIEMLREFSD
jgi:DNA-binding MarR family transcriptional regulator